MPTHFASDPRTAFVREPHSFDNGFPCFHQKTHLTDSTWFDTLNPQQWATLVEQQLGRKALSQAAE